MEAYIAAGQQHIVDAYDTLPKQEKECLLQLLSSIDDPARLVATVKDALSHLAQASLGQYTKLPESSTGLLLEHDTAEFGCWADAGYAAIARNEVAVLLLAGGQGTRLGSSDPKGCYDIGLPSGKSLFQIQAEKIRAIQNLAANANKAQAGCKQPVVMWYIMTSAPTRQDTERFFAQNDYFGLAHDQVVFFNQGTLPCFSLDGSKMLMDGPALVAQSPDGNGGLYRALQKANILEGMKQRGIKHVHMYCVDNCLVRVADPVFLGFAISGRFELATKVVRKRDAHESVGLIVLDSDNQRPCVIEYSEISRELAEKPDPADPAKLALRAANIVNHYYLVSLLECMLEKWVQSSEHLPFHIAKKKIPYWDAQTQTVVKPTEVNGIKLEQFIFDVFPSVELSKFGCLEVERAEEFLPLKNGKGSANDNPDTCRKHYLDLGTSWVKSAGGAVDGHVEVSSLVSYAGENLGWVKGRKFVDGETIEAVM